MAFYIRNKLATIMARKLDSFYPKDFLELEEPCLSAESWTRSLAATQSLPGRNLFGPGEVGDAVDLRVFLDFNPDID